MGGGGRQRWSGGVGREGKRSRVMGLILAERIIKRYYHNGSVIQLACTYTEDSPPMFASLKGGRKEWGGGEGERGGKHRLIGKGRARETEGERQGAQRG